MCTYVCISSRAVSVPECQDPICIIGRCKGTFRSFLRTPRHERCKGPGRVRSLARFRYSTNFKSSAQGIRIPPAWRTWLACGQAGMLAWDAPSLARFFSSLSACSSTAPSRAKMMPACELMPTAVTTTLPLPSMTCVPESTMGSSWGPFVTWSDSPVKEDSSILRSLL